MRISETLIEQAVALISRRMGKANAITGNELQVRLGIKERGFQGDNAARAREIVRRARLLGHPICSSPTQPAGYWWPESQDEVDRTLQGLLHRLREQAATYRALKGYQWRPPEFTQGEIFQ